MATPVSRKTNGFGMVLCLVGLFTCFCAQGAIRTWRNTAGDGAWNNPENWEGGQRPGAGDIAHVVVNGGETTLLVDEDVQVAMFWTSGSGKLTIDSTEENGGSIFADWGNGVMRQAVISNMVETVYNVPVKLRATNYQVYPKFGASAVFNRKVALTGGADWQVQIEGTGVVLQFQNEVDASDQTVVFPDSTTTAAKFQFSGKVMAKSFGQSNWNSGNTIEFYGVGSEIGTLSAERFGKVNLKVSNALSAQTVLLVGAYDKGGVVNVSGAEQVANRLTAVSVSVSATTAKDGYCIKATDPCALTLKGSQDAVTTTGLTGPLSLVWDPDLAFTQAFTNRTLDTSGSITVKRGAVALTGTSSAPNLTRIDVKSGAAFRFLTSVAAPLTSGKCVAAVESGGEIEVAEGVTVTFSDVMYDGQHQGIGSYASKDAVDVEDGVLQVPWVTGLGRVKIVESTTFYWTGVTGRWSEGASWTAGRAPDATATKIVLDAVSDRDATLTVDEPLTIAVPFTVRNGGTGRSVLAVESAVQVNVVSASTLMMTVGVGGQVLVPAGGALTLDGTGRGIDRRYTSCRIDGGELKVTGGTVAFANYPSYADVCGTTLHTGRVTMTSGEISFKGNRTGQTDELARLRFLEHSLADFSGGSYRFITDTGCLRTLGDGGCVVITNAVVALSDSASSDLQIGSGETILGGTDGVLQVAKNNANLTVAPTEGNLPAVFTVSDAATVSGSFTAWTIGGAAGRSQLAWESEGVLNAGSGLRVGCFDGFGQCDIGNGFVNVGNRGLQVAGTPGNSAYGMTSTAEGLLRVSGGALIVQGRDRSGDANYFTGISVGDGTFTTLTGTSRPLKGTLELSGGVVTNSESHVMVGGGFAEGAWKQTGGVLVDENDLWIGVAGGLGTYAISGGMTSVGGRLYVGGVDTSRSGKVAALVESGKWPTRHDAVGALTVSGGAMTVAGDCCVGYDGSGRIEMEGADGSLSVLSLTLANGASSALKFTVGADGVSPITVKGKLTISEGAKILVDLTAAPESVREFKLVSCTSVDGSFSENDITLIGKDLKLVQKLTGVSVRRQQGLVLIVR